MTDPPFPITPSALVDALSDGFALVLVVPASGQRVRGMVREADPTAVLLFDAAFVDAYRRGRP